MEKYVVLEIFARKAEYYPNFHPAKYQMLMNTYVKMSGLGQRLTSIFIAD